MRRNKVKYRLVLFEKESRLSSIEADGSSGHFDGHNVAAHQNVHFIVHFILRFLVSNLLIHFLLVIQDERGLGTFGFAVKYHANVSSLPVHVVEIHQRRIDSYLGPFLVNLAHV